MSDVNGATPPPGYMAMLGDTVGLPGLIAGGRLAASKIPGLLARYGASAGGSLLGGPFTAGLTAAQVLQPTPANAGEVPPYIKDPATGQWVPNPAAKGQSLLQQAAPQGMAPAGNAPPQSPLQTAMSAPAAAPAAAGVPLPTPRPATPAPQAPGVPLSLAPPAPGPTAPPPNLYNGPGSQNFGQPVAPGAAGGIPNGANIGSALQKLMSGNGASIGAPQTPAMQQSNPAGNILPFIKNLLSGFGGGGSSPASSDPTQMGSLY